MAGLQFVCERCGKTIIAYKESTSGRRKCSGCGSYRLKKVVPVSGQIAPVPAPSTEFAPKFADLSDSELPAVSIVIPTYNGKHHLEKCLPALRVIDYPPEKVEVIVVDNASSDGTEALLKKRFQWVRFIRQEENHYCRANNVGIKAAKGQYVCLLNNDTKVEKPWLQELVKVIHPNPQIGAVGSKVLLLSGRIHTTGHYEQPNFHWGDRGFEEEDKGQYDSIEEVQSLCGVSVLYRRECIDNVGLLDERFVAYYEDVDYSLRLRKKGWRLFYVPKSIVHHFYNGTASVLSQDGISFTRYYTERNRLLLLAKHQPDKLPDALSTFSHFYVDKDYRILYQALPVVLPALFENTDSTKLPELLTRLFESLRKVAVYETEGIRTERVMYQQRLKALEGEWQQNLVKELKLKDEALQEELRKRGADFEEERKEQEQAFARQRRAESKALKKAHSIRLNERESRFKELEGRSRAELDEHIKKIGALTVRLHLLEQELERKEEQMRSSKEESESRENNLKNEVARLRDDISRREQDLGQLSYELAVAREHPLAKVSNRLKLNTYKDSTKDALVARLRSQLKAKDRDLRVALTKLDAEYENFRKLQEGNETKVRQFLEAEQRVADQHSEILDLQKRLATHEQEIGRLVCNLQDLRKQQDSQASPAAEEPNDGWLPAVSVQEGKMPLVFEPQTKPDTVHFSITNRCNLRCRHCDIWKSKDKTELSTAEVKRLLDRLHAWLGTFTLNIAGGEPFLRKDLPELLGYAKSLGIRCILTTNGRSINSDLAKYIGDRGLGDINVSLDGFEEMHDRIRGVKGSYQQAVRALELLNTSKREVHVNLAPVIHALNLRQLPELVKWAAERRIDGITFQALCNKFSSEFKEDWWQHTELWPKDAKQVEGALDELVKLKLRGYPINNSVAHLQHMKHYFSHPGRYPGECRVGLETLHINEKGDFLLCWNMAPLGNVLTEDPAVLWKSEEAKMLRHQIQCCARECFILNCNYL